MRAMVPDGRGSVRPDDVAAPMPRADEVLVAVEAYSVNRGETYLLEAPLAEWRPGKDVAGHVVRAAADGSGPPAGATVVGHVKSAGWAEQVAVPTSALATLPDTMTTTVAAALPLAGLTALRLLRAAGSPVGRRMLMTGASGGVGHYFTELAVAGGGEVTTVCATLERGRRLREFGAHVVTDVSEAVGPFDVALESVGGGRLAAARLKTRPDGSAIWFGESSKEPVTLDFFDWVDGTVAAAIVAFDYTRSDRPDDADLATLVRLVGEDRLHPEIGSVQDWQHTDDVIADIRARRLRGNAVLTLTV